MTEVIIIDEEYHFAQNLEAHLRIENHNVRIFYDATEAFLYLTSDEGKRFSGSMLIDVVLAPGDDRVRFDSEMTETYSITGLRLLEHLEAANPELFRRCRVVLYTAHHRETWWAMIQARSKEKGFETWQKRPDAELEEIVQLVRAHHG